MKKRIYSLLILVIIVSLWFPIYAQDCEKMTYANDNQIDTGDVIIVTSVKGTAMDIVNDMVPDVCVGIFSIDKHELLAVTSTDAKGYFEFKNLKDGTYRIVAKLDFFSAANNRIRIDSQNSSKKKLSLRMRFYPGVSYFILE